jgi:D-hydroxyproline dehydrogenase subunit alpha
VAEAVVAGAGQSGLLAATRLAEAGVKATLIERLPAPGGQEPERPLADELTRDARLLGVKFQLGTLALAWHGGVVSTLGVEGASRLNCDALIVATGTRPATRGELGIAGDRCAGVVPGSAAVHLTESGVLLGRRPTVYGASQLAASCVRHLLVAGADEVTLIAPEPIDWPAEERVRILEQWGIVSVHGRRRVEEIIVVRDGQTDRLSADALILASGRVPFLNVEGAVFPAAGVFFCHSRADPKRLDDARKTASVAVASAMEFIRIRENPLRRQGRERRG